MTDAPKNHLIETLRHAAQDHPDRIFAYGPDMSVALRYSELFAKAEAMAAALVACGITPGDRVAVQVEKSLAEVALYLGTIMAGAAFLPLNTAYTPPELEYFFTDAAPRVIICDPASAATLGAIAGAAHVLTLDADGGGSLAEAAASAGPIQPVARAPDDLAAILYTSGTTGRAKGAMLSHAALASNATVLADHWQFTAEDRLIHALPIFHTHGLFVAINVTLVAGSALIFLPRFDAATITALMPQATALMGVPTFYTRLLAEPTLGQAARGMRVFISGSAPLLAETHERWQAITGHAILERYGMTETNMNTSNPYAGARRPGTVGLPLPGVEVIVTDPETGQPLPLGEVGMIEIRGPNLFSGYWRLPEKTAEELRPSGLFITGDLGRIDAGGYVTIVGRQKDLVISGGMNIYPSEVEGAINALPGVTESAVIGVAHDDLGEAALAVVIPDKDAPRDAGALLNALRPSLAEFKLPRRVIFADALPRNTMGKVQKNLLRAEYGGAFGA